MQKMTSAYANKILNGLNEEKRYWINLERTSYTYVVSQGEEPVIPDYDYIEVSNKIEEIDRKVRIIKHTLNVTNALAKVPVGDQEMSVDTILITMPQLNKRKNVLDYMRQQLPKSRVEDDGYSSRKNNIEYQCINYDLDLIKKEYERVCNTIMEMQLALDLYNQTVTFDVDI